MTRLARSSARTRIEKRARLIAIPAMAALMTACSGQQTTPEAAQPVAPPAARAVTFSAEQIKSSGVRWTAVEAVTMANTVETPGQLVPDEDHTARLSAPARGRVVAVRVNVGDRVSRGQVLVTLQSQDAMAAGADQTKATAELTSRRAAASYANSAYARAQRLLELKAISRQEVERARTDDELARAALAQAETELDRVQRVLTHLGVDAATSEIVLRSPLSGVVLSREAVPGSVVDPGAPLVTVTDSRSLSLQVAATEAVASTLRSGAPLRFTVPAFPGDEFEARVANVGGALDPTTRTLPVRARVDNTAGRLRPQMFATVWIESGAARTGVSVPDGALQLLDERPVVFVARPDAQGGARFERRDVEVGAKVGNQVQIVRGLTVGDVIVTEGAFLVKSEFARSKMTAEGQG